MLTYYRIHRAGESLETVLDARRPDGWVASDEGGDGYVQPLGVSACASLEDLRRYVREYSLSIRPGDRLVALTGRLSYDEDRDLHACRVMVSSYEDLGSAKEWQDAGYPGA